MIVKINSCFYGVIETEAVEMTKEDFASIKDLEDTPAFVMADGELWHNSYTCHSHFSGTCNCLSHRPKVWGKMTLLENGTYQF